MNDRGLNLTSSEMLKGFILSRFKKPADRERANKLWRESIQKLHAQSKEEDQKFFQAWLRSQYADTIRQARAGSLNEDFEKIGTRFHSWFRDNLSKIGLEAESSGSFQMLLHEEMNFYLRAYLDILSAQKLEKKDWESVFYHSKWGIAESLAFPLMLAPLKSSDSEEVTRLKINAVARFLETFAVRRSVNFRKFGASSIRYTMYSLVKELRGKDLDALKAILESKLNEMPERWDGIAEFRMHGMNRYFVKFLLSRITAFIEQRSGSPSTFSTYFLNLGTRPFEVEHIWADKFEEHRDEFEQRHEFENFRNRIGDLLLLPQGTNQSYGAKPYSEKVEHYLKENMLAQSLHPMAYQNNPNFLQMARSLELPFRDHQTFLKNDINERQEVIWGKN